jgi:glycosyltransferase involved in cell wall biosynthesis
LTGATAPVKEVITHGQTGLLVDFFDVGALAATAIEVLAKPEAHLELRRAARALAVSRYDLLSVCLPAQLRLIDDLVSGRVG